jgi:DNA-binding FadR family transcriptional regulator
MQIINGLKSEIYWFISITKKISGRIKSSAREHNNIIDALCSRNAKAAEKGMLQHLAKTKEILMNSGYFM